MTAAHPITLDHFHTIEHLPPRRRQAHIDVDGRQMFYVDRGVGKPVVLLHGWGADNTAWKAVADLLAPLCRVIAVDLRGHGQSSASKRDYPFSELAADVHALVQQLDLEEAPIIVGHSMGGMVAQQYAVDYPNDTDALIVLDADLNAPGLWRAILSSSGVLGAPMMHLASSLLGQAQVLRLTSSLLELVAYSPASRKMHPQRVEAATAQFRHTNTIGGLASSFLAYATRPDLTARLSQVAPRTLLVRGAGDPIMSQAKMQALANAIEGSKLVVLPGAGHMTIAEQPASVAALISDFIMA